MTPNICLSLCCHRLSIRIKPTVGYQELGAWTNMLGNQHPQETIQNLKLTVGEAQRRRCHTVAYLIKVTSLLLHSGCHREFSASTHAADFPFFCSLLLPLFLHLSTSVWMLIKRAASYASARWFCAWFRNITPGHPPNVRVLGRPKSIHSAICPKTELTCLR